MKANRLRVCVLYPDRLNLYADRGNLMVLSRRCEWRGLSCEIARVGIGEDLVPDADLYYIGGGSDRDMASCGRDLVATKGTGLIRAQDRGALILGVCGGYQLLGSEYRTATTTIEGLGIVDLSTERTDGPRLVGNIVIEVNLGGEPRTLVGFENHAGRTRLGPDTRPLGRVVHGNGNDGESGFEGVHMGTIIGTYVHGPLLPKNPWLADWLIAQALARQGRTEPLAPLDDELELEAHRVAEAIASR